MVFIRIVEALMVAAMIGMLLYRLPRGVISQRWISDVFRQAEQDKTLPWLKIVFFSGILCFLVWWIFWRDHSQNNVTPVATNATRQDTPQSPSQQDTETSHPTNRKTKKASQSLPYRQKTVIALADWGNWVDIEGYKSMDFEDDVIMIDKQNVIHEDGPTFNSDFRANSPLRFKSKTGKAVIGHIWFPVK